MQIKVFDNFLDKEYYNKLYSVVSNDNFPWYYTPCKTRPGDGNHQFIHTVFQDYVPQNIDLHNLLIDFYNQLNASAIIRNKLNCTIKENKKKVFGFHTDNEVNSITAIYYFNTTNGNTVFESGEEYESIANRLITFPSHLRHSGTNHTDEYRRLVMNINFH
jgi:hypothetical protein